MTAGRRFFFGLNMIGTDASTGKHLAGDDHLRQSIIDILTTPKGSRVLLRGYGSDLLKLIDNPQDETLKVRIVRAVAGALAEWEPRFSVSRVDVAFVSEGRFQLTLVGVNNETNEQSRLEGVTIGDSTSNH